MSKVDQYFSELKTWKPELQKLRSIVLATSIDEDLKWGSPCYSSNKQNICILGGLKDHCVLSFFKGVLLNDKEELLTKPGENTQSARAIRFTSIDEIEELEPILTAYIQEAIEVEKAGLKVDFKESKNLTYPEEFQVLLDDDSEFKAAFEALTPGRQRAYNLHFSGAKQSKTRTARVEKYRERIMSGIGINDCTCGKSKRMPQCDGSHKYL